jgi:hypothetical protein
MFRVAAGFVFLSLKPDCAAAKNFRIFEFK